MKKILLFVLLIMQMLAFEIFSGVGPNIVLPMLLFTLFYRIAVFPITAFATYRSKKSANKQGKNAIINEGCLYTVVVLLLSVMAFTSVIYMSELVPCLSELSPEELQEAYTLFGISLRSTAFDDVLVVIPFIYFGISQVIPTLIKQRKERTKRKDILSSLSDEDKELYLEEESKAKKKKYTLQWFLLKALSLYGLIITLLLPRYLALYLLFISVWRQISVAILDLLFKHTAQQSVATQCSEPENAESMAQEVSSNHQ